MELELTYKIEISKLLYNKGEEYLKKAIELKNQIIIGEENFEVLNEKCILSLQKSKYFFQYSNKILREK